MKTFWFYLGQEQEQGDALGIEGGQKIEFTLPDGYDLKREDPLFNEDYTYTVMQGSEKAFAFAILPLAVVPPPLGPLPAAVILREKGDTKEGTLQ
jgi:hypothetical protein